MKTITNNKNIGMILFPFNPNIGVNFLLPYMSILDKMSYIFDFTIASICPIKDMEDKTIDEYKESLNNLEINADMVYFNYESIPNIENALFNYPSRIIRYLSKETLEKNIYAIDFINEVNTDITLCKNYYDIISDRFLLGLDQLDNDPFTNSYERVIANKFKRMYFNTFRYKDYVYPIHYGNNKISFFIEYLKDQIENNITINDIDNKAQELGVLYQIYNIKNGNLTNSIDDLINGDAIIYFYVDTNYDSYWYLFNENNYYDGESIKIIDGFVDIDSSLIPEGRLDSEFSFYIEEKSKELISIYIQRFKNRRGLE